MRRSTSSYFIILSAVCVFYFGSLYWVSRTSEPACFTVVHEDKSMAQQDAKLVISPSSPEEKLLQDVTSGRSPIQITPPSSSTQQQQKQQQKSNESFPVDNSNDDTILATTSTNTTSTSSPNVALPSQHQDSSSLLQLEEKRANAVIVILCRNNELRPMRRTIREFEDRFNKKYQYPYVFLNDEPFTEIFKTSIRQLTDAPIEFGLVPNSMWSVPDSVNQTVMNEKMSEMQSQNILYGGSLSYRHMCRFNSGFFYRHPLIAKYDYYWRVEPGVHFYCDLDYDPFLFMQDNNKKYSFTITLQEIPQTIPTLWDHTMKFAHANNLETNFLRMFGDEENGYNMCHFWSNFEIASLDLWRDNRYQAYFSYLDSTGNFFYERWGDAIVHSLAAGMFLNKSEVHFFNDIGYKHDNFAHCVDDGIFGKCMCPEDTANFDYGWGSCLPTWNEFPENGVRWDFKSNGDQIIGEEGRVVSKPEYALSKKKSSSPKKSSKSSSSS